MIQRNFRDPEGAEAIRLSHGQFGLVVQAFNDAAREPSLGSEIVEEQLTMAAQRLGDLLHWLDARAHDLLAPVVEELASPRR
jgi:hypothetical protein